MIPIIYKGNISPDYSTRATFYGVGGIPAVFVSGYIDAGVGTYSSLEYYYNDLQNTVSPLQIDISYSAHPDAGIIIDADIEVTEAITTAGNQVIFYLIDYYDYEYFSLETAGTQQAFTLSQIGESDHFTSQLLPPSTCDFEDLYAVVIIQSFSGQKEILQCGRIPVTLNSEITGSIHDDFSQQPLENVIVRFGSFQTLSDESGNYSIELVSGEYNYSYLIDGYIELNDNLTIETGEQLIQNVTLDERLLPPNNLRGTWDNETIYLSWNPPGIHSGFTQNFESGDIPENWESFANEGIGWYVSSNGGSGGFDIPPHTQYAVSNDDAENDDSSMDLLILPPQDFSRLVDVHISFDSYFTGNYDHAATIEISIDDGDIWNVISEVPASNSWQQISVDLQECCGIGYENVLIAFHSDDDGGWTSGWAIDNIILGEGGTHRALLGYYVYEDATSTPLNDILIIDPAFQLLDLINDTYLFRITAQYSSGESEPSNELCIELTANDQNLIPKIDNLNISPNPFNPETTIFFNTESECNIELTIYNLKGQKIKYLTSKPFPAGNHSVFWNGKDDSGQVVVSGIYFCLLQSGNRKIAKKMMIIK